MYLDEHEKNYYEAQQKFGLNQNSLMQEAISNATVQRELNKQVEIARNLILLNPDNQFTMKATGLTVEQIEQLRSEKK